jgi:hypothetical protein
MRDDCRYCGDGCWCKEPWLYQDCEKHQELKDEEEHKP